MIAVLDSSAMIAFLHDEPGADVVEGMFDDKSTRCYAHSVNLCEVYDHFLRGSEADTAREAIDDLFDHGVTERHDMDREFWVEIGFHKSRGRIAFADCVCLTLARRLAGQVVTSDRHEFEPLVPLNLCPIVFIR